MLKLLQDSKFVNMKKILINNILIITLVSLSSCNYDEKPLTQTYTITWKNYDGTVLEVDERVPYGTLPSYNSEEPSKPSDTFYDYHFDKWYPSITEVDSDTTYTALFSCELTHIQLTFDINGGVSTSSLDDKIVESINASDFPFDCEKDRFAFRGWSYNGKRIFDENGIKVSEPLLTDHMVFTALYEYDNFNFDEEIWQDPSLLDDSGEYDVKIWVDEKIGDLTKSQVNNFEVLNNGKYKINLIVEPMSEGAATSFMLQDFADGADIYGFYSDFLLPLKTAGALSKIDDSLATFIAGTDSSESLNGAKVDDDYYAIPMVSDGYFLYYDKTVIPDEDATDISKILLKCSVENKTLNFESKNGYYAASYFMATGCHSNWAMDSSGKFISYDDDFNSSNGFKAALGLKELSKHFVANRSDASKLGTTCAAVVSGIWEYETALKNLGENLGCIAMPSFNVDENTYHLSSFEQFRYLGIKPQTDHKKQSVLQKLTQFLASRSCQFERFKIATWCPSNNVTKNDIEVASCPPIQALNAQHPHSKLLTQRPGSWFMLLGDTVKAIMDSSTNEEIWDALQKYEYKLDEVLIDEYEWES